MFRLGGSWPIEAICREDFPQLPPWNSIVSLLNVYEISKDLSVIFPGPLEDELQGQWSVGRISSGPESASVFPQLFLRDGSALFLQHFGVDFPGDA
ncbi:UNVERIFIED_CONTAM: hypothetical protein PYX00_004601 [Menopon gallinae]|uniref:Uncharacterized protein n=1 Tax=Menopon gallinae TaxID=328185 RepID=A0AAW2I543_9NEOP